MEIKCEHYEQEKTKKDFFLKKEYVFCSVKKCPYGNSEELSWEGEPAGTICRTKGLLKKVKKETILS